MFVHIIQQAAWWFISVTGGRSVSAVRLRPVACWDCGFESRREYGCLSVASVVLTGTEISETGRPQCGVFECDRESLRRP